MCFLCIFFFFKQKTAYEMRISDWSSDVCSSDLTIIGKNHGNISNLKITNRSMDFFEMLIDVEVTSVKHLSNIIAALRAMPVITSVARARGRSEEHTSELQSLMRNSYAVFCLKKKKHEIFYIKSMETESE